MPFLLEHEDSLFNPNTQKIYRKRKKIYKRTRKFNSSIWTSQENQKYIQFLLRHSEEIQDASKRITTKIFVKMSQYINSRSSKQCRSHHQKIVKKHLNVQSIIQNLFTNTLRKSQKQRNVEKETYTFENSYQDNNQQNQQKQEKNVETQRTKVELPQDDDLWIVVNQKAWQSQTTGILLE